VLDAREVATQPGPVPPGQISSTNRSDLGSGKLSVDGHATAGLGAGRRADGRGRYGST
jgi:hypothetical protein